MSKNYMKKYLVIILILIVVLIDKNDIYGNVVEEDYWNGNGTQETPYEISNAEDLIMLANSVNSGNRYEKAYFVQTNNIDLADIIWTPIGIYGTENSFNGIYDGNGYYIENLTIESDGMTGNVGFFGQLGGTIINFGVKDGKIAGTCVGTIASHSANSNAKIVNCYSYATLVGDRTGGIADNFNGSIINCWSDCTLYARESKYAGPIISYSANSVINSFFAEEKMQTESICKNLNDSMFESATLEGIRLEELNVWIVDENNNIVLSNQKIKVTLENIIPYLVQRWIYIIPIVLIVVSIILIFVFYSTKETKR